jgi:hypothetical protein
LSLIAAVLRTGNRDHAESKEKEIRMCRMGSTCARPRATIPPGGMVLGVLTLFDASSYQR